MEKSLDDKLGILWNLAFTSAHTDNNGGLRKETGKFGHIVMFSHDILDGMGPFINKWLECRMSIADMNKYTPEYVENKVDVYIRFLKKAKHKYNIIYPVINS